jgi:hypothetical protein
MTHITVSFPQEHYTHFLELVQKAQFPLEITKVEEEEGEESDSEPTKAQILQNIKEALQEVKLIKVGKMKGMDAYELLHEL